jgi:prepilin-type N-terminal cleavage/methylation domain-containing protein
MQKPRRKTADGLRDQRGFSLAELLVTVGIMALIGPVLVGSLYQMQSITSRESAYLEIEADFRTSMQWLGRDFRMAKETDLVDGGPAVDCAAVSPSPCMSLTWTDEFEEASAEHSAAYALIGGELRRTYDGTTHVVGRSVSAVSVALQGTLITVTLTSASGEWADVNRQFVHYFHLRAA